MRDLSKTKHKTSDATQIGGGAGFASVGAQVRAAFAVCSSEFSSKVVNNVAIMILGSILRVARAQWALAVRQCGPILMLVLIYSSTWSTKYGCILSKLLI